MRALLVALVLSLPALARAGDDATQLWLDHAVHSSEHVVRGSYDGGRLDPAVELKGKLATRPVSIERDDVELRAEERAPGMPSLKGEGVFFLQGRFDGKGGAETRRFIEWQGPPGVAWVGTRAYLGYRAGADDRFSVVEVAAKADFEAMLGAALARDEALLEAVAIVDTKARAAKLRAIVEGAHDAPAEATSELGPDPFAERALTELGLAGQADLLDELRRGAKLAWLKPAAIRALAAAPGSERRLEAIALDAKASEDEVVAAVDMLFSAEKADVAALEKLSFDERARVRRAVASALREKVKDLATLERLMKDPDPGVRRAATEAARAAARRLELPMPGPKKKPDPEDGGD